MPVRRPRYTSPPPPHLLDRSRGILDALRQTGTVVLSTMQEIHEDILPFHRVVISQLLVIIIAVELLRPDRLDLWLSVLLGLVKIGLVADCTSIVALRMRQISDSSGTIGLTPYKVPLVTAPFMELALVMLMLRQDHPSTANRFLVGSIYAKPMVIGALCLLLDGIRTGMPRIQMRSVESATVFRLLALSGVLFLAPFPRVQSMFQRQYRFTDANYCYR
jgi:Ca2+/H+ antiporter